MFSTTKFSVCWWSVNKMFQVYSHSVKVCRFKYQSEHKFLQMARKNVMKVMIFMSIVTSALCQAYRSPPGFNKSKGIFRLWLSSTDQLTARSSSLINYHVFKLDREGFCDYNKNYIKQGESAFFGCLRVECSIDYAIFTVGWVYSAFVIINVIQMSSKL